jgi:hypothetical protein
MYRVSQKDVFTRLIFRIIIYIHLFWDTLYFQLFIVLSTSSSRAVGRKLFVTTKNQIHLSASDSVAKVTDNVIHTSGTFF